MKMKKVFLTKVSAFAIIASLLVVGACGGTDSNKTDNNRDDVPDAVDPNRVDEYEAESGIYGEWKDSVHTAMADVFNKQVLKIGSYSMPLYWEKFGTKPSDGRSLFISLHGGGGAPAATNIQQWNNQKTLYKSKGYPKEGIYLAPRAITDTWDLHFRPESDEFYEQIIHMCVAFLNVNPDKVYIMGYSAGGDGVWRIAPRMADHWAAASMMAGHPGDVSLLPLRNLPFMIWCGAKDIAYNRNEECANRIEEMDLLQAEDPEGYIHSGHILSGKEHWMDLEDAAAFPWMTKYIRNPYPNKVVWVQGDGKMKRYFYWIGAPEKEAKKGSTAVVEVKDNEICISECDYSYLNLYLNDKLVDFSKNVKVVYAPEDKEPVVLFDDIVTKDDKLLKSTLKARGDKSYSFPAMVKVVLPKAE